MCVGVWGEVWENVEGVGKCVGVWGRLRQMCGKVRGGGERCGEMCWGVREGVGERSAGGCGVVGNSVEWYME